jgi:hypothetical protein
MINYYRYADFYPYKDVRYNIKFFSIAKVHKPKIIDHHSRTLCAGFDSI